MIHERNCQEVRSERKYLFRSSSHIVIMNASVLIILFVLSMCSYCDARGGGGGGRGGTGRTSRGRSHSRGVSSTPSKQAEFAKSRLIDVALVSSQSQSLALRLDIKNQTVFHFIVETTLRQAGYSLLHCKTIRSIIRQPWAGSKHLLGQQLLQSVSSRIVASHKRSVLSFGNESNKTKLELRR